MRQQCVNLYVIHQCQCLFKQSVFCQKCLTDIYLTALQWTLYKWSVAFLSPEILHSSLDRVLQLR